MLVIPRQDKARGGGCSSRWDASNLQQVVRALCKIAWTRVCVRLLCVSCVCIYLCVCCVCVVPGVCVFCVSVCFVCLLCICVVSGVCCVCVLCICCAYVFLVCVFCVSVVFNVFCFWCMCVFLIYCVLCVCFVCVSANRSHPKAGQSKDTTSRRLIKGNQGAQGTQIGQ